MMKRTIHRGSCEKTDFPNFGFWASAFSLLLISLSTSLAVEPVCTAAYGNYNTHNNAQYFNGNTYFVYPGSGDDLLDAFIGVYHHADGRVERRKVGEAHPEMVANKDDHGNPVMLVDAEGFIHVVYGGHGEHRGEQFYFRTEKPEDITSFRAVNNVPGKSTYPNLTQLPNGDIALLYRGGNNHRDGWYLVTSSNGGDDWSEPLCLLAGGTKRTDGIYFKGTYYDGWYGPDIMYQGKDGTLHFYVSYHACADDYPKDAHQLRRTGLFHFQRTPEGIWQSAGGHVLELPVTRETAQAHCTVFDPEEKSGPAVDSTYPQHFTTDEDGNLYALFKAREDDGAKFTGEVRFTRWTGREWTPSTSVGTGSNGFIEAADGKIDFFGRDHLRSTDMGASWEEVGTIYAEPNSAIYPVVDGVSAARLIIVGGAKKASANPYFLWGDGGLVSP